MGRGTWEQFSISRLPLVECDDNSIATHQRIRKVILNIISTEYNRSSQPDQTDVFTPEKRSAVMSRIRSKNTKPEMIVRSMLHRMGFRFRLHRSDLPGKPDIVLPKHKTVIFVNGCYWHPHPGCKERKERKPPKQNVTYWQNKFARNLERDEKARVELEAAGWRVAVLHECDMTRGRHLTEEHILEILKR